MAILLKCLKGFSVIMSSLQSAFLFKKKYFYCIFYSYLYAL